MHLKKSRSKCLKMSNDEKIIKYINNESTSEARSLFEEELKKSLQLRKDYDLFEKIAQQINVSKSVRLNQNYLNSVLYEFHNNKTKLSKSFVHKAKLGYAIGILLAFFVSILIFNNVFWQKSENISLKEFTESLNENQKVELLENISGDIEDYIFLASNYGEIELTDLLQSDLSTNNEIAEVYDISYTELVGDLSPSEANTIYNEILSKNFSNEVKL